jgi:hypothetical protein
LNFHDCVKDLKRRGGYKEPMTDRIDFCRRNPDENAWIANLAARKTDFVLISVLHQNDLPHIAHDGNGFPVELSWAISHKDKFKAVYANPQVRIFKFKPQE